MLYYLKDQNFGESNYFSKRINLEQAASRSPLESNQKSGQSLPSFFSAWYTFSGYRPLWSQVSRIFQGAGQGSSNVLLPLLSAEP